MFNLRRRSFLAFCCLAATAGLAQTAPVPSKVSIDSPSELPGLVWNDALNVASAPWGWDSDAWLCAALGTASVLGTALVLDNPVHRAVLRNDSPSLHRWANNLAPIGNEYSFVAAGGFYVYGLVARDAETRATGADTLSALLITGASLIPLKYGLGRARPDDNLGNHSFKPLSSRDSFASAHTAFAFTAAAAITEHYSDTWVQVTAYGLATAAGLSRLEQNVHWTSDVLAGALIGTTIGKLVTRMNQKQRFGKNGRVKLVVEPILGLGYQGVRMGMIF